MATADWEFVFDGVVGFLTSPMWQIPVMNFIEKSCIVFDPSEENCLPWGDIHKDYKKLVEDLLTSYLKDVGILEEQFVQACSSPSVKNRPQMQAVFEQIWAAEDFEIFKRMMVQRNIELELQALQLIQHQQQQQKSQQQQNQKPTEEPKKTRPHQQQQQELPEMVDDRILKEVLERSKKEYEAQKKENDKESVAIEKHYAETHEENVKILKDKVEEKKSELKKVVDDRIKKDDEKEGEKKVEANANVIEKASSKENSPVKEVPLRKEIDVRTEKPGREESRPVKPKVEKPKTAAEAASSWLQSAKAESLSKDGREASTTSSSQMEDMKRREQYLKEQRDRLLQLKSKEREKQLETYAKSQPKRPTSARVARQAITGASEEKEAETIDPKKLELRKALADKLKKDVIYK